MAFAGHGFEALSHVGLVHAVQVHGGRGLLQRRLHHPPQIGTRGVGEVRHGLFGSARQAVQGLAQVFGTGVGLHIGG